MKIICPKTTLSLICLTAGLALSAASAIPLSDFTCPGHRGSAVHHVTGAHDSAAGLAFTVVDEDPWLVGPPQTFPAPPAGTRRVEFSFTCMPTACAIPWQLFYAFGRKNFNEGDSVQLLPVGAPPYTRFAACVPVNTVAAGPCRFRLDPPGGTNSFTVATFTASFLAPIWSATPQPPPPLIIPASTSLVLRGADWELRHDPDRLGAFRFLSRGKTVENAPAEPFVYQDRSGHVRALDWSAVHMDVEPPTPDRPDQLTTSAACVDADGRRWRLCRRFTALRDGKGLAIDTDVAVDLPTTGETASVLHLPYLTLFVDRASRGRKRQALLAGVEYLDDEPSSNMKEIRTHEHDRRIPAAHRISAPFAAFADDANWLSATWDHMHDGVPTTPRPHPASYATVFDTPDRTFASGGHLLAFWVPAVGPCRFESSLDIYAPQPFRTGSHVVTLRTGAGSSVADALAHIQPNWLPPPDQVDTTASLELLAHGWLDSDIRRGTKIRHAIGNSFHFSHVADAPVYMQYLAAVLARSATSDKTLGPRLQAVAEEMLKSVPPDSIGNTGAARHPIVPILYTGDLPRWLDRRSQMLHDLNRRLASGKRLWHKPAQGKEDLGETLGADHCNGFTSMELKSLLEAATWCGDDADIAKALDILDKFTALYHGTVPRGAQPWEMPLHTPDILAAANIVRCYTFAYALRPDPAYLREARHWAHAGLSMVYLVPPPGSFGDIDPVGRYATCAVMGATHWSKPNWIGRPVQWCGLLYAAALWDLARLDRGNSPGGAFWHRIATGIATSGIRQCHTAADPASIGLLPDSWNLEQQTRYAVPINPGNVQENFAECIGQPFYSFRALGSGAILHVLGDATRIPAQDGSLRCAVKAWPQTPSRACIAHLAKPTSVTFNGADVPREYITAHRTLVVTLPANASGELVVVP